VTLQGTSSLTPDQRSAFNQTLHDWQENDKVRRFGDRAASLWTASGEEKWLGWLDIVKQQLREPGRFSEVAAEVQRKAFSDIVLLGMGGSSLCPEVLAKSFGRIKGFPAMHVLDSTDPGQVRSVEQGVNLASTLFIVSSKSGSTLEPNIFKEYFFDRAGRDGSRFFTITDPGSKMEQVAKGDHFARIFHGLPSIGGRYSALSDFGMIPAAAMGVDVFKLLQGASSMAEACAPWHPIELNPGVSLGALLGTLGRAGRDKVTFICSPGIQDLGAWLEQLIAESTGKQGVGLIPVDREPLSKAGQYGADRVFVYLRLTNAFDESQEHGVALLEAAGQPVIRIPMEGPYQLGAEFFRWEIATAVAGAVLGINPFDQPDVEAAKIATRKLTDAFEQTGALPEEKPALVEDGIKVFCAGNPPNLTAALREHFQNMPSAAYVALLAYIEMNPEHERILQALRENIRDTTHAATCLGFGPRFLHSTGQAYKGGPGNGVFLQITADDAQDLPVPDRKYTFGIVKAAQAQGDLEVLRERGRRTLRVHLGKNVTAGLMQLAAAVRAALK